MKRRRLYAVLAGVTSLFAPQVRAQSGAQAQQNLTPMATAERETNRAKLVRPEKKII
jgi:hypothetical protein